MNHHATYNVIFETLKELVRYILSFEYNIFQITNDYSLVTAKGRPCAKKKFYQNIIVIYSKCQNKTLNRGKKTLYVKYDDYIISQVLMSWRKNIVKKEKKIT